MGLQVPRCNALALWPMLTGTLVGCAALPEKGPTSGLQVVAGLGAVGYGVGWSVPPPIALSGTGIHMILLFFKFAVEAVRAATHSLLPSPLVALCRNTEASQHSVPGDTSRSGPRKKQD